MWTIGREGVAFVGGGRAALLQLAHPVVAQGVAHHSRTRQDLAGRFQRTFTNVFSLVFGEREQALASARRVHAIHRRVNGIHDEDAGSFRAGDPYEANDERALRWVWATLTETSARLYDACLGPLGAVGYRDFYADSRRFALLFGLSAAQLPRDWPAFEGYFADMVASDELAVGARARELCGFLLTPPRPALAPLWRVYTTMTAGLMPPRLRADFGLPDSLADRALYRAMYAALRASYRHLPHRLRFLPAYVEAERRIGGLPPRDKLGRLAEETILSALRRRVGPDA